MLQDAIQGSSFILTCSPSLPPALALSGTPDHHWQAPKLAVEVQAHPLHSGPAVGILRSVDRIGCLDRGCPASELGQYLSNRQPGILTLLGYMLEEKTVSIGSSFYSMKTASPFRRPKVAGPGPRPPRWRDRQLRTGPSRW